MVAESWMPQRIRGAKPKRAPTRVCNMRRVQDYAPRKHADVYVTAASIKTNDGPCLIGGERTARDAEHQTPELAQPPQVAPAGEQQVLR